MKFSDVNNTWQVPVVCHSIGHSLAKAGWSLTDDELSDDELLNAREES